MPSRKVSPIQIQKLLKSADNAFKKQHYQKAVDKYKQTVSLEPRSAYGWFKLGLSLQRLQKKEAIDAYLHSLKIQSSFEVLFNISILYLEKENYSEAEKYLKKSMSLSEKNDKMEFLVWYNLSRVYLAWIKPKKALDALNKAQKYSSDEEPILYYLRGETYQHLKNDDLAIKAYLKSLKLDSTLKESIISLSSLYIRKKDESKAISLLSRYLKHNPNDLGILGVLGDLHYSKNDFENARLCYSKLRLRENKDSNIEILIKESKCLQVLQKNEEALDLVSEYLETKGETLHLLLHQAELYAGMKNRQTSENIIQRVCRQFPEVNQHSKESSLVASLYQLNKNYPQAEKYYNQALELDNPDFWFIKGQLIQIMLETGNLKEAKEESLNLLSMTENTIQKLFLYHILSITEMNLKHFIDAEKYVTSGLKEAKENDYFKVRLSILHAKIKSLQNDQKSASKILGKLIKEYPDSKKIIQEDKELKKLV